MLPGIMCRVKLEAMGFGLYLNVQGLLEAASSTGKSLILVKPPVKGFGAISNTQSNTCSNQLVWPTCPRTPHQRELSTDAKNVI